MICWSYFVFGLWVSFHGRSYGNELSDNIFMNGGFKMDNGNEEMVCTVTCIKKDKPPTSPCDQGGSTTTTKIPCPLANTTLPPTNPPSSTLSSTKATTTKPTTTIPPSTTPVPTVEEVTTDPYTPSSTPLPTTKVTTIKLPTTTVMTTPNYPTLLPSSTTKGTTLKVPTTIIMTNPSTNYPTLPPSSTRSSVTVTNPTTTTTPPSTTCGNKTKTICIIGDPHYVTWDGAYFDYHGTCPYNFVSPCLPNAIEGFPDFAIKAQNKIYTSTPNIFAEIDSIQFEMYQQKVHITLLGNLYVNEQRQYFPYFYPDTVNPKITIRQNGWLKTIETASGINLEFNGYRVCVTIPDCDAFYGKDKLCGLGGNYDGTCSNDMVYRNGTDAIKQNATCHYGNTVSDWANSHIVDYFHPDAKTAECVLGRDTASCDTTQSKIACKAIADATYNNGVFKQCKAMGDDVIDRMFQACADDVCIAPEYLCKSLEDFARECQRMINGTDLGDWRSSTNCPAVQCPANSVFKSCVSSCQPTCTGRPSGSSCNSNICVEGCQCDNGYVIDNTKTPFGCIKIENCGCTAGDGVKTLTQTWRNYALYAFNSKRATLAAGLQQMDNGTTFPPAKIMNKLAYDCGIEFEVRQIANTCNFQNNRNWHLFVLAYSNFFELGEGNLYYMIKRYFEKRQHTPTAIENGKTFVYNFDFPVALANATSTGCHYSYNDTCYPGRKTVLYCGIYPPPIANQPLYEVLSPLPTSPPSPVISCPAYDGATKFNNAQRKIILDALNVKRATLAAGLTQMANITSFPKAKNMKKLVYSCSLEAEAQKFATNCSNPNALITRLQHTELYLITEYDFSFWIQKFFENREDAKIVNQNGTSYLYHPNFSFAEDTLTSVGCWYSYNDKCLTGMKTVLYCAISPKSVSTAPLYEIGNPCTQDSHCTKTGVNKCDASLKLCYSDVRHGQDFK